MTENLDPCEAESTMHFYIRALEHEAKFVYNMNSRKAYKNRRPIAWPGKRKGAKAAKAYKQAKARFQKKAKKTLGLPIGTMIYLLQIETGLHLLFSVTNSISLLYRLFVVKVLVSDV